MKRGAEKQMTREEGDEEDMEEISSGSFKKADENVLATRKIRALPKRAGASPAPALNGTPPPSAPAPAASKFTGFSGFGSSSSSTSFPFSPSPQAAPTTTQPPTSATSFSAPSFSTPPSFFSSQPTVAPTASNTAKTFASFLQSSTTISETGKTPQEAAPAKEAAADDSGVQYYKSLRGLNASLLSAMSKAVEEDPFFDTAVFFEQYKDLRSDIQKKFQEKPVSSSTASASMPAPPSSFTFGPSKPSTSTSDTAAAQPSTTSSGFSFATPPSTSSVPAPGPGFSFTPSGTPGTSIFGTSGSQKDTTSAISPFGSSSTPSPFGKPSSTPSAFSFSSSASKPESTSSTSVFGSTTSSNPFGMSDKSTSNNLFGSSERSQTTTNLFGGSSSTASSSSKPVAFGGFAGFGKPSTPGGSIGNPVGFGFGSASPTPEASTAKSTGFSFGAPPAEKQKETGSEGGEDTGTEGEGNEDKTGGAVEKASGTNPHDEEGEGEEEEDTLHAIRVKAHRMNKTKEGTGWAELGVGILRVKKHKETGSRRLLMRNSTSGKININFNVYEGMKASQNKKSLTFIGHDAGESHTYTIRMTSEDQAKELKEVIDREIAFVKAKEES